MAYIHNKETQTHRTIILKQIDRTNVIISGFNSSPEVINAYADLKTYVKGGHEGKKIALAVLVLLANAKSILPLKFFTDLKHDNKYKTAFEKQKYDTNKDGYLYMVEDPQIQQTGIQNIMDFYVELLNAIYCLPDYSDIKYVGKQKDEKDWTEDDEDLVFGMR